MSIPFPKDIIWNMWILFKANFFAWEVGWGQVLTTDQLQKRLWSVLNRRFLFKLEGISVDYILLYFIKSRALWHLIFSLFSVVWMIPLSVKETLLSWHKSFVGWKRRKVWRAALCISWTIWWEQNQRAFENKEKPYQNLKHSMQSLSLGWHVHKRMFIAFDWFLRLGRVFMIVRVVFCPLMRPFF